MAVWEKVWDVTTIRYSGTCNHPFTMIIIMIMSLAGVAVSRAALRPSRSASMPTSEGGELLVCLASIAFSNTEGEKREREGGRDSDIEIRYIIIASTLTLQNADTHSSLEHHSPH